MSLVRVVEANAFSHRSSTGVAAFPHRQFVGLNRPLEGRAFVVVAATVASHVDPRRAVVVLVAHSADLIAGMIAAGQRVEDRLQV